MSAIHWTHNTDPRCTTGDPVNTATQEDVTCKRCIAAIAKATDDDQRKEGVTDRRDEDTTDRREVVGKALVAALKGKAKAAATKAKEAPKKAVKVVNLHLADSERATGTRCSIKGAVADSPDAVTCKVCRSIIDGDGPSNKISNEVKKARKAFASFKARISYMLYMDAPAHTDPVTGVSWALSFVNTAGITFTAKGQGSCCSLQDSEGAVDAIDNKGELEDAIRKLGWDA